MSRRWRCDEAATGVKTPVIDGRGAGLAPKRRNIWRRIDNHDLGGNSHPGANACRVTRRGKKQPGDRGYSRVAIQFAGTCQFGTFLFSGRLIKVVDRTMRKQ